MSLRQRVALWSLGATIFAIPWQDAVVIPGVGSVARVIGTLALVLTLISLVEPGRIRYRPFSIFLLVATAYVGWTILSFFWTIDPAATRETIMTHTQLLLFVWAVWQLGASRSSQHFLAQSFVLGGYVTALNIIYVFLFRSDSIVIAGRVTAAGANQNDVATVMAIALAMAWWLATRRRGWLFTVINMLYLPLALFAIILTGSRGGTIAAVLALAAIPLTLSRVSVSRRLLILVAVVGVGLGLTFLPNGLLERAAPSLQRVSDTPELLLNSDLTGRTEIWRAGFRALLEKPIVGYGGHAFPTAVKYWLGYAKSAHNAYLSVAVTTGLIGLVLFCLMLLATLVSLLIQPSSTTRTAQLILLGTLFVSLMPLGWEYFKTTWFVMALLTAESGPTLVPALRHARRRLVPGTLS